MKKVVFITHLSPKGIRSSLRQVLIDTMEKSLHAQTYTNWKALWIGEQEREENKIKEVVCTDKQGFTALYARQDVLDYINDCDYLVKLDDDDIIMPYTLEKGLNHEFDVYCDQYHTFYDCSSGTLTQQKRPWIASTCIHKKEHAWMNQNGVGKAENFINSLFYGSHGRDWIAYYSDKKIVYAEPEMPVYVRVLSPTSITAGAKKFPVLTNEDIEMSAYFDYIKQFGDWHSAHIQGFDAFKSDLERGWVNFSQTPLQPIKGITWQDKIKEKLSKTFSKK
jgi:glycosyltransferase involved in cell wall biosynthesis